MTTAIRLTAIEFLRKIRQTEEGQITSAQEYDTVIKLLVVKPQEHAGIYVAPSATTFVSSEAYVKFVMEINLLTDPPSLSGSRNRVIRRPDEPKRISARQFINRLKHSEDGEIKLGHVGGNFEITLIVTEPAEDNGTFMAPRIDAFDYDFGRYSEFIGEILKLVMVLPEERKTFKIRAHLPWDGELDNWQKKGNDDG